jgi:hypothetical protein
VRKMLIGIGFAVCGAPTVALALLVDVPGAVSPPSSPIVEARPSPSFEPVALPIAYSPTVQRPSPAATPSSRHRMTHRRPLHRQLVSTLSSYCGSITHPCNVQSTTIPIQ